MVKKLINFFNVKFPPNHHLTQLIVRDSYRPIAKLHPLEVRATTPPEKSTPVEESSEKNDQRSRNLRRRKTRATAVASLIQFGVVYFMKLFSTSYPPIYVIRIQDCMYKIQLYCTFSSAISI